MSNSPNLSVIQKRFGETPIIFEITPPERDYSPDQQNRRTQKLIELFETVEIDGINIPEIQEEQKKGDKGKRRSNFKKRVTPREYTQILRDKLDTQYVINRVIVSEDPQTQENWLLETHNEYNIHNVVLVGGESSEIDYPGPSVTEGNSLITRNLNDGHCKYTNQEISQTQFLAGNICISTRRREGFDEPDRMLKKIESGADFFTTQIIAESESPTRLLSDLSHALERKNIDPPMIFWSFAPIISQKDVDFLRWLGVKIPESVENSLLNASNTETECIKHLTDIWSKLQSTNETLPVKIPLGLNVSVVAMRNFDFTIELSRELCRRTERR